MGKIVLRFILQRLLRVVLVFWGVSILAFVLMHSAKGSPWTQSEQRRIFLNYTPDPIVLRNLDRQFGLDLPIWQQYLRYMFGGTDPDGSPFCGVICGNLGPSLSQRGRMVNDILFSAPENGNVWQSRLGYTLRLALYGFLFTALTGIPLGIALAVKHHSRFDRCMSTLLMFNLSIPSFVIGFILIIVLASWLQWIKVVAVWDDLRYWLLAVGVLSGIPMATLARLTKTAVREAMSGDYVRTARAKGLYSLGVVCRHILPNAIIPIITALWPVLMELVAGSFIIESLFGFPGIGGEYCRAVVNLDYAMIMGLTLLYSLGIVTLSIIVDSLYGVFDPRLRNAQ